MPPKRTDDGRWSENTTEIDQPGLTVAVVNTVVVVDDPHLAAQGNGRALHLVDSESAGRGQIGQYIADQCLGQRAAVAHARHVNPVEPLDGRVRAGLVVALHDQEIAAAERSNIRQTYPTAVLRCDRVERVVQENPGVVRERVDADAGAVRVAGQRPLALKRDVDRAVVFGDTFEAEAPLLRVEGIGQSDDVLDDAGRVSLEDEIQAVDGTPGIAHRARALGRDPKAARRSDGDTFGIDVDRPVIVDQPIEIDLIEHVDARGMPVADRRIRKRGG